MDLGRQNAAKLAPKSYQKSFSTSKGDFLKKLRFSLRKNNDFEGSGGRSWEPKSIKNQSKNVINLGRHLDIDFWLMLVDFGSQVGEENPPKLDPKFC